MKPPRCKRFDFPEKKKSKGRLHAEGSKEKARGLGGPSVFRKKGGCGSRSLVLLVSVRDGVVELVDVFHDDSLHLMAEDALNFFGVLACPRLSLFPRSEAAQEAANF